MERSDTTFFNEHQEDSDSESATDIVDIQMQAKIELLKELIEQKKLLYDFIYVMRTHMWVKGMHVDFDELEKSEKEFEIISERVSLLRCETFDYRLENEDFFCL